MKKFRLLLATILIMLCFTGCAPVVNQLVLLEEKFLEEEISAVEDTPHIGFCPGEFDEESQVIMSASAFTDYESDYTVYSSSIHYDTLTDNEKLVYHAFEYAMENGYSSVLLDNSLVEKSKDLGTILELFSLDSPLLEQNLFYEHGTFTTYHNLEADSFFQHQVEFDGYYITVDNFDAKWWPQRLEAIDKAKEIVATLSPDMSDAEKAEKLFLHLAYNTRYALSKTLNETTVQPNLYDALISGKTQCDGFSNAISLLFNMAGIPCSEKIYHAANDELGHTWNCFEIDGKWYNADATGTSLVPTDTTYMHAGIDFAFPDIMQEKKNVYSDHYPECTESLYMPIDAHYATIDDEAFVENAKNAYDSHHGQWALIMLDSYDEGSAEEQLTKLATRMNQTVYYMTFDCTENRTALLIYEEGLINYTDPTE